MRDALRALGHADVRDVRVGKRHRPRHRCPGRATRRRPASTRCAARCSRTRSSSAGRPRSATSSDASRGRRLPGQQLRPRCPARPRRGRGDRRRPRPAHDAPTSTATTSSSCRAASATATTCAPARWRRTRRSWARSVTAAARGVPVLGICNGFQILLEAGLLPGAMLRNADSPSTASGSTCASNGAATPFTAAAERGRVLRMPIAHGEGNYHAAAGRCWPARGRAAASSSATATRTGA